MVTDIIDLMLDIGSLLSVAYNRKTGKVFTRLASMLASATLQKITLG
jgi:hypothetical protein